jgi:hypothetical protein
MDIEIRAFAGMGRLDAVDSVLAVMASLPAQAGADPALRPVWAARELRAHGHEAEADALFAEAIDAFSSRTTSSTSYNLGRALFYALRWADAAPIFGLRWRSWETGKGPCRWRAGPRSWIASTSGAGTC